jgi:hypothetical protein
MRKQSLAAVAVGVVVLGLAASLAWAENLVEANIPFAFVVIEKEMPAGSYVFRVQDSPQDRVVIQSKGGSGTMTLSVQTRLADRGVTEPKLYFDKTADGKHYLSELHLPGTDGFAFSGAPGKHTHEAVSGTK